MKNIRLSEYELLSITEIFKQYFLENDNLWLFGSRANLNAKGGDIDLYVESDYKDAKKIVEAKINFLADLQIKIGEQKIDLIVKVNNLELPIHKIAKQEGVKLV